MLNVFPLSDSLSSKKVIFYCIPSRSQTAVSLDNNACLIWNFFPSLFQSTCQSIPPLSLLIACTVAAVALHIPQSLSKDSSFQHFWRYLDSLDSLLTSPSNSLNKLVLFLQLPDHPLVTRRNDPGSPLPFRRRSPNARPFFHVHLHIHVRRSLSLSLRLSLSFLSNNKPNARDRCLCIRFASSYEYPFLLTIHKFFSQTAFTSHSFSHAATLTDRSSSLSAQNHDLF